MRNITRIFFCLLILGVSFCYYDDFKTLANWEKEGNWFLVPEGVASKGTGYSYLFYKGQVNQPFVYEVKLGSFYGQGVYVGGYNILWYGNHLLIKNNSFSKSIPAKFNPIWRIYYINNNYYLFFDKVFICHWKGSFNGKIGLVSYGLPFSVLRNHIYYYIKLENVLTQFSKSFFSFGTPDTFCYTNYNLLGRIFVDPDYDVDCCIDAGGTWAGWNGLYSCCGDDPHESWCVSSGCCIDGKFFVGYECLKDSDCPSPSCSNGIYTEYKCIQNKCVFQSKCSSSCLDQDHTCCSTCTINGVSYPCTSYGGQTHCTKVIETYDKICSDLGDVYCSAGWTVVAVFPFISSYNHCDSDDCKNIYDCTSPLSIPLLWDKKEAVVPLKCKPGYASCNTYENIKKGVADGCETKLQKCRVYCKYNPSTASWEYWYTTCKYNVDKGVCYK